MKKNNTGKVVTLNPNMNRKNVILDAKCANGPKKNIMKQLEVIASSFVEINSIINRLNMKKCINEGASSVVVQSAKKCLSQAQAARTLAMNLDAKYSEDQKNLTIEDLNARIAFLEERLSQMK